MYHITDIQSLGTDYTVADQKGNIIKTIQVIPHTEILEAALGPYTDDFDNYADYLEKSIAVLSGFEGVEPDKVLWFSSFEEEVVLSEVIQYAIQNGYDKIILEHIELVDDFE